MIHPNFVTIKIGANPQIDNAVTTTVSTPKTPFVRTQDPGLRSLGASRPAEQYGLAQLLHSYMVVCVSIQVKS
jgi:hypothetical protein